MGYLRGTIDSFWREVWIGNRELGVIRNMVPCLNKVKREEEQNFQGMPIFKGWAEKLNTVGGEREYV